MNWILENIFNVLRFINRSKPRILLFTDSRGFDVKKIFIRHHPLNFYLADISLHYCVDYQICPKEYTTLIDFIEYFRDNQKSYDLIIVHVGIVDFAPRPRSAAINKIYLPKKKAFDAIFGEESMQIYLSSSLGIQYNGEDTINMYSLSMAEDKLLPILINIPNLIWINLNRFVPGWRGNYYRERPKNIGLVNEYSDFFTKHLRNVVDISDWDEATIKTYTYDNIHLNRAGSKKLSKHILRNIKVSA